MTRSWRVWAVFALCLAAMLGGVGALSLAAIRLERSEAAARRTAAVEEDVRLALWRMDSAVAPLVARESGRPWFVYAPLYAPERVYTRGLAEIDEGYVLVPSPLLRELPEHVLLHFQVGPDGAVSSPQVPEGRARSLTVTRYTTAERIAAARERLDRLRPALDRGALVALLPGEAEPEARDPIISPPESRVGKLEKEPAATGGKPLGSKVAKLDPPAAKSSVEFLSRARQVSKQNYVPAYREAEEQAARAERAPRAYVPPRSARRPMPEGAMTPLWLGGELVLVRRVQLDGAEYLQGCLLDWRSLRAWLQGEVADLFPEAALEPVASGGDDAARLLASIPARLDPRARPPPGGDASPLPGILGATWALVLLAAAAVLVLLLGLQALSERRAAFVSAVTHELRTPLTTFRMYAEMLAEGMVQDEARRAEYLDTLRREALRLGHLVENVLAYGRVERGRTVRRPAPLALAELLARQGDRLRERASGAGMELRVAIDPALRAIAEPGALEQILFNLVDNACKYAAAAAERRIELSAAREGRWVALRVRDFGPGLSAEDRRRLFVPFGRSAARAAGAAPGVGLGLALCRSLARSLGGSIALAPADGPGACFIVRLKAAA
ncbi:MAG TPA: HAMP domain-containing sensor histidine kinase [Anaeromyxobacter sp.]|nr:HAMP domain-containing sensor histidine kinase [Anaeromyxobacter sp.]